MLIYYFGVSPYSGELRWVQICHAVSQLDLYLTYQYKLMYMWSGILITLAFNSQVRMYSYVVHFMHEATQCAVPQTEPHLYEKTIAAH